MRLSEMLSRAAREEAELKRRREDEAEQAARKAEQKRLWDALNAAAEFVPSGPADRAAWRWAGLIVAACTILKSQGEMGRLPAMRYQGPDRARLAGTEAAYHACQLGCANRFQDLTDALMTLIETTPHLVNPFCLYLESVRDNRRWWEPAR